MWVSPNHPSPPRSQVAPVETGRRLATLARGRGEELRISLAEFQGHPYLSLRVWAPGSDGRLWPVRGKGVSVRIRELPDLADAIAAARGLVGDRADNPAQGATRAQRPAAARGPTAGPGGGGSAEAFDEFEPRG